MVYFPMSTRLRLSIPILACSLVALAMAGLGTAIGGEHNVFSQFTAHIMAQVTKDKQAFAQASTCLSWFYKGSKTPPPAVQGIRFGAVASTLDQDCPGRYPGGMDSARDDFAKTQTLLSLSLTVYEFALVADRNDDRSYNATELTDLLRSLSLMQDRSDSPRGPASVLAEQFDRWHRARSLDIVMQGMGTLYEQGYRVTAADRAELDRVMQR